MTLYNKIDQTWFSDTLTSANPSGLLKPLHFRLGFQPHPQVEQMLMHRKTRFILTLFSNKKEESSQAEQFRLCFVCFVFTYNSTFSFNKTVSLKYLFRLVDRFADALRRARADFRITSIVVRHGLLCMFDNSLCVVVVC